MTPLEHDCLDLDRPLGFPTAAEGYGLGRSPFHDDELGAWVVSSYADIDGVLRDAATFSSKNVLGPHRREAITKLIAGLEGDPRATSAEPFFHIPVGSSDGDEHRRHRSYFNRAFTPARVKAYEPHTRALCRELADAIVGREGVEFVHEFTVPLTVRIIADAIGMPDDRYPDLKRWSDGLEGLTTLNPTSEHVDAFLAAAVEFTDYITPLVEDRRAHPAEDVISAVALPNEAGERLTNEQVVGVLGALLLAGNETTTAALAGTVLYLSRRPDLQDRVRTDNALIPALVEEGLRLTTPAQALFRTVTCDTYLGGQAIAAGDLVFLRFAAGNRDAAHYEAPLCPRVDRVDQRHLSFGRGPHVCPGAPLARIELSTALETLLDRTSVVRLSDRDEPVVPTGGAMTARVGQLYVDIIARNA